MDSLTIACHAAALAEPVFQRPGWAGPEYRVLEVDWNTTGQWAHIELDYMPGIHVYVREFLGMTKVGF